jgi:hypothetical protein
MLALRLALLNGRWLESWQEQLRWRQHQRQLERRTRHEPRFVEQQAKRQPTHQKTGRTEAQYRWGRHTFSRRMLQQASGAKK